MGGGEVSTPCKHGGIGFPLRDSVAKLSSSSDVGLAKWLYFSMKPLVEVVDKVLFCDHYE